MSGSKQKQTGNAESNGSNWKNLYRLGGIAALLAVLAGVVDISISVSGEDFNPASLAAIDWFVLFQGNGLAGLRALGLINVVSLTVSLPFFLALYIVHRKDYPVPAMLAMILYLLGAAIYISGNAAIPMFVLSGKYAAAATEFQSTILAAAGEAALARGADFTPGSFIGFILTELAGLLFCCTMLFSKIFGRTAAYAGITGFALLSIFTVWATFIPVMFDAAMLVATVGGLSSVTWYILTARKLFQLEKRSRDKILRPATVMKGA